MAEADPQTTSYVHDAKTHLSRLIERALAGKDIVVARAGKPCIRLVPVVTRDPEIAALGCKVFWS